MVAKLGSEPALQRAIQDGDVVVVKDGGKDFYTWRSISVSKTSGTNHETSVTSGNVRLDNEGQQQMSAFFDNFNPQLGNPKASSMDPLKSPSGTSFNFNFDFLRTLQICSCDCACFCLRLFSVKKCGTSFAYLQSAMGQLGLLECVL